MSGTVLVCGRPAGDIAELTNGTVTHELPSRPGKADVDGTLGADRLIVVGTDADLAAVVLRLLRKGRLDDTAVGYVPVDARSAVARLWGLPVREASAVELALSGTARGVPLLRDDSGGVLLGEGLLERPNGVAYCDDERALRGEARAITVRPGTTERTAGLTATVSRGLLRRAATHDGRAFQFGGGSVTPRCDGVTHPRPVDRWTWYRHTTDLSLVLPGTTGRR